MEHTNISQSMSKLAILSLILAVFSFVPVFGLIFGVVAIILSLAAKSKIQKGFCVGKKISTLAITLAILGIFFTGYMLYSVKKNMNYWADPKVSSQTLSILNADAELIYSYKDRNDKWPNDIAEMVSAGEPFILNDPWGTPIRYVFIRDYFLLISAGPDKVFGTGNDIAISRYP